MLNRTLQVKMVKTDKEGKDDHPTTSDCATPFEGKMAIASYYTERVVEKVASAVVTYIVVDTIRQIAIERAKR